MPAFWLARSKK